MTESAERAELIAEAYRQVAVVTKRKATDRATQQLTRQFAKEDDALTFFLGTAPSETLQAFVFLLEATRRITRLEYRSARALLRHADAQLKSIAATRKKEQA